jgi:hypothetical protein
MEKRIYIPMKSQPDELTCGPTCLQSIYEFYHDLISLEHVVNEVHMLEEGGTFASNLACHALQRGYQAVIYSFNLQIFDPSWYALDKEAIYKKLEEQLKYKKNAKLILASKGYQEFLRLGGELKFEDLTKDLLSQYLINNQPIIVGLSATYLYKGRREIPATTDYDDVRGEPSGHFVVLTGFDKENNLTVVTDPYLPNPISQTHFYKVTTEHLICSILLGVFTYDANLLIITPGKNMKTTSKGG